MRDPMIEAARRASASKVDEQLPASFEATDWAKAFNKRFPDGPDIEILTTWFDKALTRGFAEAFKLLRTPPIAAAIPLRPHWQTQPTGAQGAVGAQGADYEIR